MKKKLLIFIFLVLMIPFSAFTEEKTIIGDGVDHGGYGGFEIEYIWRSDQVVHFTIHTGIEGGKAEMLDGEYVSDKFFYIEPTFNGEVNLLKFFRINTGASYLRVDNIQGMPGLSIAT